MGFMGFGMIFWVLLLIAIIYALTDRGKLAKEKTARGILDERYAKGEITSEEYRRMKEELR